MLLQISQIQISSNRQRRTFDPEQLQTLADSIDRNGLLQPLVVRPDESGSGWLLVCGERRLKAIRDYLLPLGSTLRHAGAVLHEGEVPVVALSELSQLDAEEAELEENIRRVDLSWQERAAATARLQALRTAQASFRGESTPSVADIALEVRGSDKGQQHEDTRREIIVSRHLGNPTVAAAKSLDEAWKALKREEETSRNVELARTVGLTFTADLHEVRNEDSLEWMRHAAAEQFDVILTDPPYGMSADEFGDSGGKVPVAGHGYEDSPVYFAEVVRVCAEHLIRLAKPQAHLYWFCDIDNFDFLKSEFEAAGWWVFRTPLIWHKPNGNRAPWPQNGPHRKYEICLYGVKGDKPVTKLYPDLVSYNPDDNLGHSAQKPVALYEDWLKRSVRPGDVVFDPFCGTGPIFPAAHGLKCRAIGIEREPAHYGIALRRVQSLKEEETV